MQFFGKIFKMTRKVMISDNKFQKERTANQQSAPFA